MRQTSGEVSESKARRIEKYVGELASITEDQPSEISRWPVRARSNLPFDVLGKIIPVKLKENGDNVFLCEPLDDLTDGQIAHALKHEAQSFTERVEPFAHCLLTPTTCATTKSMPSS